MNKDVITVEELLNNGISKRIYANPQWNNTGIITAPGYRIEIIANPTHKWKTLDKDWVNADGYVELCDGWNDPTGLYKCTINLLRLGSLIGKIGTQYQVAIGLHGQIDLAPDAPREALELAINQYGNNRGEGFIDVTISSSLIPH